MKIAAIEIGSGKIRLCIADLSQSGIDKIDVEKEQALNFADFAHQNQGILSEKIREEALKVLSEYKKIALQLSVVKCRAFATDIFRDRKKAVNGQEFINDLSQALDIPIVIIDQDTEGRLGYLTIAHIVSKYFPPISEEQLVTWDSGRSSAQLTAKKNRKFEVYQNPFGVVPIQKMLEELRAQRNQRQLTLNPISTLEINEMIKKLKSEGNPASSELAKVFATGTVVRKYSSKMLVRTFQVDANRVLKKEEVKDAMDRFAGKTDAQIIHMTGGYPDVDPPMLMMSLFGMYAIMDRFSIASIQFAETPAGNTYGMLLDHLSK